MDNIDNRPRQRVITYIRNLIAQGALRSGDRLPAEQRLVTDLGVSRGTVRAALGELTAEGLIESQRGFGCRVSSQSGVPLASVASGKTICYLVPLDKHHTLLDEILCGVEEMSSELGFSVTVINSRVEGRGVGDILKRLESLPLAGVVFAPLSSVNYYEYNSQFIDFFEGKHLAYVVVDSPVECEGMIRGNFIGADGYSAMRQVVRRLVGLGHRTIGSIRVFPGVYTSDQRKNGIVEQLHLEGLGTDEPYHVSIQDTSLESQGREEIRHLMSLAVPPTAVICTHDTLAMNVMDELRKMGYRVPEDVSVFGFDDDSFAVFLGLSTVRQPFREIGSKAVEMIAGMLSGKESLGVCHQEFLPCELVLRQSVSACRP